MQVFGSFLRPGFFLGAMSSFAKALPNESPHPMNNALGRGVGDAVAADEASARWFGFANADRLGTKAPTEYTLTTIAISTRVKLAMSLSFFPVRSIVSGSPQYQMPPRNAILRCWVCVRFFFTLCRVPKKKRPATNGQVAPPRAQRVRAGYRSAKNQDVYPSTHDSIGQVATSGSTRRRISLSC